MDRVYDCTDPEQRAEGIRLATEALTRGELVVLPTDTVYGIAADALNPAAVELLRQAKQRGREAPPAVLIPDAVTINRLAMRVPGAVHQLTPRFWPGALTIVLKAQPLPELDLGDADGAIALRVPGDDVALELLRAAGPLAVSGAGVAGHDASTTAAEAVETFGDAVAVYLDRGTAQLAADADDTDAGATNAAATVSTILDATDAAGAARYRVLRHGGVSIEQLRIVLGDDNVIDATARSDEEAVLAEEEVASAASVD